MTLTWLGILTVVFLMLSCVRGFRRGFIREAVSTVFVLLSIVMVWFINPYVNTFLLENTSIYEKVQDGIENLAGEQLRQEQETGERERENILEEIGLPGIVAKSILEDGSPEVYQYLGVDSFGEYVSEYLARMAVNSLSFLLSFFLATILIRIVTYALNILAQIPVIKGVNKLGGAILGGGKAILFVWIAMLILTILCKTPVGKSCLDMVEKDPVLCQLYEWNFLAKMFTGIFYGN